MEEELKPDGPRYLISVKTLMRSAADGLMLEDHWKSELYCNNNNNNNEKICIVQYDMTDCKNQDLVQLFTVHPGYATSVCADNVPNTVISSKQTE